MNAERYTKHVMWTKEMIHQMLSAWSTKSTLEIAEEMGLGVENINYMAHVLRKKGVNIPTRRKNGIAQNLVDEFLSDYPEFRK